MALKQFLSSAIKYVPQAGFSATYTENGGVEASQDFLIRNSDLDPAKPALAGFVRGVTWESLWPEVPKLYKTLTLKSTEPTDRGDGFSIIAAKFTGYQFTGNGSSGSESTVPTVSLTGQLEDVPLSQHHKWTDLSPTVRTILGYLLSGIYVWDIGTSKVKIPLEDGSLFQDETLSDLMTDDAISFANIIASGETTFKRGGFTYSYQTDSSTGFTASQLNALGKIVNNPPGSPATPSSGYKWFLVSPTQTQSGPDRFIKSLDFQLILQNETNTFLYE